MGRQQPEHQHQTLQVVARDRLANGLVVSTVRLPGTSPRFETKLFSKGWPHHPSADELDTLRADDREAALANHRLLVEESAPEVDPRDPNWVFKLLGLPPRHPPGQRDS